MILNDCRLNLIELTETVGILYEIVDMTKFSARWAPQLFKSDQNLTNVIILGKCLMLFKGNPTDFLQRIIIVNETWIHYYNKVSNKKRTNSDEGDGILRCEKYFVDCFLIIN